MRCANLCEYDSSQNNIFSQTPNTKDAIFKYRVEIDFASDSRIRGNLSFRANPIREKKNDTNPRNYHN